MTQLRSASLAGCCTFLILMTAARLQPVLVAVEESVVAEPPVSLKEFGQAQSGSHFYGIYLLGRKVGWLSESAQLITDARGEVFEFESKGELRIQFFGVENSLKLASRGMYALTGDGPLVFFEEQTTEDDSISKFTAELDGDGYDVVMDSEGQVSAFRTGPSKDNLRSMFNFNQWLRGKPLAGEQFTNYSFDSDKFSERPKDEDLPNPDKDEIATFIESRVARWGGSLVTISRLKVKMGFLLVEMEVREDGIPTKFLMGPLEARMEEETVAKDFELVAGDMLASVPVKTDMGTPEKVTSAILELRGIGGFQIPQSESQAVIESSRNLAVVRTQQGSVTKNSTPLTDEERADMTAATPQIQSDHETIINLARRLAGTETDPVAQADRLQDWVFHNLEGSYTKNASTALRVLENRAGDCTEHTLLFVAMARSMNIPAREVTGLIFHNDPQPGFYWHAWAEIHDGQGWRGIDPAFNEVDIDAAHLQLVQDSDDWTWFENFGKLKIEVREFKTVE